jgi:ABC-type Fe3+-siderophore transport system permease subunit
MIITDGMFFSGLVVPSSTIRSVILSFSSSVLSTSTTTVVAVGMVGAMASRIMVAVLSEKKNYSLYSRVFFLLLLLLLLDFFCRSVARSERRY